MRFQMKIENIHIVKNEKDINTHASGLEIFSVLTEHYTATQQVLASV